MDTILSVAGRQLKKNKTFKFLKKENYDINNYSCM